VKKAAAIFALVCALLAAGCGKTTPEKAPVPSEAAEQLRTYPAPVKIKNNLYDMTVRWQAMFGLDGRLTIMNARKDASLTPKDGPVRLAFEAEANQPGWYAFTFINVDAYEQVYQIRQMRLQVREGAQNSKPPIILCNLRNQLQHTNQAMFSAAPKTKVIVKWEYSPGGEGIPGGWKLLKTSYSDSKIPLSIPGFEKAIGE